MPQIWSAGSAHPPRGNGPLRLDLAAATRRSLSVEKIEELTVRSVDRGSPAAWSTRWVLETFWASDVVGFERAFEEARRYAGEVLSNLAIVTGGLINSIARARGQSYEDLLPVVWSQLAGQGDTQESSLMRAMVSAWSFGDTSSAEAFDEPEALTDADPVALVMNFAAIMHILLRELCEITDQQISSASETLWESLGTR